jgi:serine protease inhibitor
MAWNPLGGLFSEEKSAQSDETRPAEAAPGPVRFAFNLFQALTKASPAENIFISPASIHFVLSLTCGGASGETRAQMAKALELQGLSDADVHAGAKILKTLLEREEPTARLAIANSLWSRKGVAFKPEFAQMAREDYAAEARELDFALPEAAATINQWCSDHTNGKIDEIVKHDQLKICLLVLVNALYFKGVWAEGFDFNTEATQERPFALLKGGAKTVPLMTQFNAFQYQQGADFQAVKLAYGEGFSSMIVMLPAKGVDLSTFIKNLNAEKWEAAMQGFAEADGRLSLPRFKLRYEKDLNDDLKALGIKRAFTQLAEFPLMSTAPLMIGLVKHKTFVDVNEKGTEAAAVTAVLMVPGCAAPAEKRKPFKMIVDRPFICAIRDERAGTILFLGAIVEP